MAQQLRTFLVLAPFLALIASARAQGTAFTYQGRLASDGVPFTGNVEFQPTLWNAPSNGAQVAANSPLQVLVGVTNGLFTLPLDFGPSFPGAGRWVQLEMRTNIGPFTTLLPRQEITPAPYAITASNITGTLPAGQLSGTVPSANLGGTYSGAVTFNNAGNTFTGNGSGLTALNGSQVTSGVLPDARLSGNVARTSQVWLLGGNTGTAPGSNYVGTADNQALEMKVNSMRALRLEPITNGVSGSNIVNVVAGSPANAVGAGVRGATIGGGGASWYSGASRSNSIDADFGTVSGGSQNFILTNSGSATIGGGYFNLIDTNSSFATVGGGYFNRILSDSVNATVGGGVFNTINPLSVSATIGGGRGHIISGGYATIGGGRENYIYSASYTTIAGGTDNLISTNSSYGFIGGGEFNSVGTNSSYGAVLGGYLNRVQGDAAYGTLGGGYLNVIEYGGYSSTLAGGFQNSIRRDAEFATLGGGYANSLGGTLGVIAGGSSNVIGTNALHAVISGGATNIVEANSMFSTIGGGRQNLIQNGATHSTIGGGRDNVIQANSTFATIPGGRGNSATNYGFAAGFNANANHIGSFVWGDFTGADIVSTNANSVTMRAGGGYRLFSNSGATVGAFLAPNGASWSAISDRDAKKNIEPVDVVSVLEKLARVPVQKWNYKSESNDSVPHLGPMAQDFKAAFYPGRDDKSISTLEFDGVALAAIQGLNQKVTEQDARLKSKDTEIQELRQAVTALENAMKKMAVENRE